MDKTKLKKKLNADQYISLYKRVQELKEQTQGGRRVIKYINNYKSTEDLEKPIYQPITYESGNDNIAFLQNQQSMNSLEYTNQQIFENYIKVPPRLTSYRLRSIYTSASSKCNTIHVKKQQVQPTLDVDMMEKFMNNFTIEKQISKKSKYETIMNRLKQKNSEVSPLQKNDSQNTIGDDLHIPNMLKALTPSYDTYKKQRDALFEAEDEVDEKQQMNHKKKPIIPRMIKKLGLQPCRSKKDIFLLKKHHQDQLKNDPKLQYSQSLKITNESFITDVKNAKILRTDPNQTIVDNKSRKNTNKSSLEAIPIVENKYRDSAYKSSLEAIRSQQQMMDDHLQIQAIQGPYFFPQTHKSLMQTKQKIKGFYNEICSYSETSHYDQVDNKQKVIDHMGYFKSNISTWQQKMLTQSEKMDQNLLQDIKDQVILDKNGLQLV